MKKQSFLILPMLAVLAASSISFGPSSETEVKNPGPAPSEFSSDTKGHAISRNEKGEVVVPDTLTIHYQDNDHDTIDYLGKKAFYLWNINKDGQEYKAELDEGFGMKVTVHPTELSEEWGKHDKMMLIVKNKGTWDGQSSDTEISYAKFQDNIVDGALDVYVIQGEGNSLEVYGTQKETEGGKILNVRFTDWKTIRVAGTHDIASYQLHAFPSDYYELDDVIKQDLLNKYLIDEKDVTCQRSGDTETSSYYFDIKFPHEVPTSLVYQVSVTFKESGRTKKRNADPYELYSGERFETYYTAKEQDLGVFFEKDADGFITNTTFKLWAPMCARVVLNLYDVGTTGILSDYDHYGTDYPIEQFALSFTPGGVWSCEIDRDITGMYYTYTVYNSVGENEVVDPYAKAAGLNGERGMILDFDTTDPEGWDKVEYKHLRPQQLSVYECHIRDLTMHETWKSNKDNKPGTYGAFAEAGTTLTVPGEALPVKTGYDHIEELGFNAVQILPFFDGSGKEVDAAYNWGYNPVNFNVIEGAYSSDPYNGEVRVSELKNLVKAYSENANNTRIIMDVVYNHVSSASTVNLNKIMPKYFFRYAESLNAKTNETELFLTDGAGCGNEVRTEATMMRKFITESVSWWASEYKIKGFRFDLMGLIDTETMRSVKEACYAIDPEIVLYGEGWTADKYNGAEGTHGSDSWLALHQLKHTETSPGAVGVFNDSLRNALKGENGFDEKNIGKFYGYISQGQSDVGAKSKTISGGFFGHFKEENDEGFRSNPDQIISYASCHDNFALYDQLHYTLGKDAHKPNVDEPAFNMLTNAILGVQTAVAFSSGISFFRAGEELLSTKIDNVDPKEGTEDYRVTFYGQKISHNSYASTDATNAFDYSRKVAVNYAGKTESSKEFFAKYCEMINKSNQFEGQLTVNDRDNYGYFDDNYIFNGNYGPTGFGMYMAIGNKLYHAFFCGRESRNVGLAKVNFNQSQIVFNSSIENTVQYDSDGEKINLMPGQFIIFAKDIQ